MRRISRSVLCTLLAAIGLSWSAESAAAGAWPAASLASNGNTLPINVGGRWYDDDYYYPPEYYLPPPPPVRVYRYAPPPVIVYEPPVYGWLAPPRPSNCGKYRYWNGERCADARYDPPYIGPRW